MLMSFHAQAAVVYWVGNTLQLAILCTIIFYTRGHFISSAGG